MLSSKNKGVVGEVGSALAGQINDLPDKCGRSDPIESEGVSFAAPTFFGPAAAALDEIERLSAPSFQDRLNLWMVACFGEEIASDKQERNHRFLEEALELVQACGCARGEAYQLVDYVFDRDVGEPSQEVGGVKVTLAALCLAQGLDMAECGETELARIWTKVEKIRAKQAAKPKNSPLPQQHYSLGAQLNEAKLELARVKAEQERRAGSHAHRWL